MPLKPHQLHLVGWLCPVAALLLVVQNMGTEVALSLQHHLGGRVRNNIPSLSHHLSGLQRMNGLLKSGLWRTGVVVRALFKAWDANSTLLVHCTFSGCPFLVRSERVEAAEETLGMNRW